MSALTLRLAIDRYDRHMPFFDGTAPLPPGVAFEVFQVGQSGTYRDGTDRHGRMLKGEFDIAEFSLSTFLLARQRGLPIVGVPVFSRRLFTASQMYVRADAPFEHPRDLAGRRVAISSFQTTFSVLAKGDLKFEYGVPWEDIRWCVSDHEKIPIDLKPGVVVERIGERGALGALLEAGRIDAVVVPHPIDTFAGTGPAPRRLFRDTRGEELRYFARHGYVPIMHVLAMREDLAAREPWLPAALVDSFDAARRIAAGYYEDPSWSTMPRGRAAFEESLRDFGDCWRNGVAANRANLARFVDYSVDQGLLARPLAVDELFAAGARAT